MTDSHEALERALDDLLHLSAAGGAATEIDKTLRSFGVSPDHADAGGPEEALAARRAVEHFLLERHSSALEGVPVELAAHGALGAPEDLPEEELLRALVGSFSGVFEVTDVRPGEGLWVRDLLAFGEHPVAEAEGSRALAAGDVLVGRLFPLEAGLHRISHAAGVFRNRELVEALTRDLERARQGKRGVLRLSQAELETMFWGRAAEVEREHVLARARQVLVEGGLADGEVELVFARLAAAPAAPRGVAPGVGDALGEILAGLAFSSEVDLGAARRALLEAWPRLASPERPAGPKHRRSADVREAIAAFDRGRSEGRELEELFEKLERDLDIEQDEPVEVEPAPDFPGVVGAMVDEFLWDIEREHGRARAEPFAILRKLSDFGGSIGVFEELGARQLLSFATIWLPEWGELGGADDAHSVLAALRAFSGWCEERQEVPLREVYERELAPLESSLPRIAEANLARRPSEEASAGEVFLVREAGAAELRVQDSTGAELTVAADPALAVHLRPGDHLRASAGEDGALTVHCCYPPECAALKG